jgi:hypothetical protein
VLPKEIKHRSLHTTTEASSYPKEIKEKDLLESDKLKVVANLQKYQDETRSWRDPKVKIREFDVSDLVLLQRPHDEDVSHGFPLKNIEQDPQAHNYTYERPMTRAKVKQLQHEVKLFLNDYEHASPKNHVLSNGGTLLVLKFESQVKGGLNT